VAPTFRHVLTTSAGETNKTVAVWRAVPEGLLDFQPREKTNPIRTAVVGRDRRGCLPLERFAHGCSLIAAVGEAVLAARGAGGRPGHSASGARAPALRRAASPWAQPFSMGL